MNLLVKTRRATIALPGQAFWEISGQKEWVVTPGSKVKGSGIVYSDNQDPATKEVVRFKTTPKEDIMIKQYLQAQSGNTGPYHWLTKSCRTYSMREFHEIKRMTEEYRKAQKKKCKK